MAALTVLFVWIGGMLGGKQGAITAFFIAGAMNLFGYWFSDKLVLRRYQSHEVGPDDTSCLYRLVAIRMLISRIREYAADAGGAQISGKPLSLASALNKIHQGVQRIPLSQGNPAHSHLFIINPFFGGLQQLFSTHPPVEERIRRLQALASEIPPGNGY